MIIPFNTGIYTVPEASRLTRVASPRIRRWLKGYKFFSGEREHVSPPVWRGQLQPVDGALALGFLDLMEIRVVDAFLRSGVSWKTLREAERRGSELFHSNHPFCTQRFATDGRGIFVDIGPESDEPIILEIINSQAVFDAITYPFFKDLQFSQDRILERSWPLGESPRAQWSTQSNWRIPSVTPKLREVFPRQLYRATNRAGITCRGSS